MPTRQDLNKITSTISGFNNIPNALSDNVLNTFQFINKGPTVNQAWSLLSGGDLSGYLVAEQINAIRDVVSALMQVEKQTTPAVNTLINNPNNFMNMITPEYYDKPSYDPENPTKGITSNFTVETNELSVETILDFPDILYVDTETFSENTNILYFPVISMYQITYNPNNNIKYEYTNISFSSPGVITFEIWIRINSNNRISAISLPSQYTLLDNQQAFPSELTNISNIQGESTIYVFPIRISNLQNKQYPDVQISYAYRFIAGKNKSISTNTIVDKTVE